MYFCKHDLMGILCCDIMSDIILKLIGGDYMLSIFVSANRKIKGNLAAKAGGF